MVATIFSTSKKEDRLAQLWADLLAEPVPPHPAAEGWRTFGTRFEMNHTAALSVVLDREPTPPESMPHMARSPVAGETKTLESFLPSEGEPVSYRWKRGIEMLFHSLLEPENAGAPLPFPHEANLDGEAFLEMPLDAAHEATLSLHSPFRWEAKPAWINSPLGSKPPLSPSTDPRYFVARPKIPVRPLHKQPFYRRLFFYLRRWLNRTP